MNFLKLKISTKTLIVFLLVSLLPLVAVSFVLVTSANTQLLKAASTKQQIVADNLADRVDIYLAGKTSQLDLQARINAGSQNNATQSKNLAALVKQDKNIDNVSILGANGIEQVRYNRDGKTSLSSNPDKSGSDAFKAAYFLSGKPYISSVSYDNKGKPFITIAVPILKPGTQAKTNSLNKYGTQADIDGVIVAQYNISDLWQSVLSTRIGQGGYAYVVDGLGYLVAHPNKDFLAKNQKITNVQALDQYRRNDFKTQATTSETGQSVISTPRPLSRKGWAVVVEEPVSSIYSNIFSYIRLSATVGIIAIILSVIAGVFFSRQLTRPIRKLSKSAKKLGAGELDQVVDVHTNDELEELANTFNSMSLNIKQLVSDLQSNNLDLLTEQTKLSRIIDSVTDGIIALGADGSILSINPPAAALIDKQPAELAGVKLPDVYAWTQENERFKPETATPGVYHYSDLVLPSGSKISYLDIVVFVLDRKDSDVNTIITIRDLTKSRELDFMKLDFVAIAAHELRTPLTVVMGYLDMLNTDAIKEMSVSNIENLQKAIVGTDQLRSLINKLLNIAHIERGDMEIFLEKIDLAKMVRENVHQHQTQASQRLQKLDYTTTIEKPVYVPADPASMTEVLNNLIGNAIKYTPEKGHVEVRLLVDGDKVKVEVKDNGPGIPQELRTRLFTKFYRAERSLIAGTRGTGLGLFISKTIIELQGGTIGLEKDSEHGSTFYFTLPIYKPELHDKLMANDNKMGGVRGWFKKNPHR